MHLRDYIEHLKTKPEHVRRRIALGSSAGITALVFVGWLAALGASGTLAFDAPAENPTSDLAAAAASTKSNFSSLLGAASAYTASPSGTAPLTIVDGSASTTLDEKPAADDRTVIPF